ncbi:MAG: MotA/TolQ/ExbB proton channel family protein [Sterolibacterium sp.]|jgi:biopolymer transport protein ExbB|nr:MotA/TolQ/ExbB proton channel family protein [Sterolibacterium sp.]MBP9799275.1 MotA/TolQ/ExbB proton channel family protein [Sterolibacterium sp.]
MSLTKRISSLLAAVLIAGVPLTTTLVLPSMVHAEEAVTVTSQPSVTEPASAAPAPAAVITDKETVTNPYGLDALWKQGDFVAKGTLVMLLIMSFGSWYILAIKLYEQYKLRQQARHMQETFWAAGSIEKGIDGLAKDGPFRYIAETAVNAVGQYQKANPGTIDLNSWVIMAIQRASDSVQSRMQDGLSFLATVGSTAPFVGLFGTVWGIYHALTAIGIAGQASIDKVAGPVGEALIMTAIGLAVAVPAVLSYNWLVRRNKLVMEDVRGFSGELHAALMIRPAKGA